MGRVRFVNVVNRAAPGIATIVEFDVLDGWKGVTGKAATLHTPLEGGEDTPRFTVGETYLVFAVRNSPPTESWYRLTSPEATYDITNCGGSLLLREDGGPSREQQLRTLTRKPC